jgi:hypothetical protein
LLLRKKDYKKLLNKKNKGYKNNNRQEKQLNSRLHNDKLEYIPYTLSYIIK